MDFNAVLEILKAIDTGSFFPLGEQFLQKTEHSKLKHFHFITLLKITHSGENSGVST